MLIALVIVVFARVAYNRTTEAVLSVALASVALASVALASVVLASVALAIRMAGTILAASTEVEGAPLVVFVEADLLAAGKLIRDFFVAAIGVFLTFQL
jgi:hypothetical protein